MFSQREVAGYTLFTKMHLRCVLAPQQTPPPADRAAAETQVLPLPLIYRLPPRTVGVAPVREPEPREDGMRRQD